MTSRNHLKLIVNNDKTDFEQSETHNRPELNVIDGDEKEIKIVYFRNGMTLLGFYGECEDIEFDGFEMIQMQYPIKIEMSDGDTHLSPFTHLSDDIEFSFNPDAILTIAKPNEFLRNYFLEMLQKQEDNNDG